MATWKKITRPTDDGMVVPMLQSIIDGAIGQTGRNAAF